MPGIFDSPVLKRLQENLLGKGAQNRNLSLDGSRINTVAKYVAKASGFDFIADIADWVEDNQMVIGGWSRGQFLESIKGLRLEDTMERFGDKK